MSTDYAALRARMTALWERAHAATPDDAWPQVAPLVDGTGSVPPHHTAWAVGPWDEDTTTARHVIVTPSLDPAAPASLHRRLAARVVALGTGRCPLCSAVAGLSQQPPAPGEPRVPWHVFDVFVTVRHATGCPADDWTDAERHWFPAFRED